MPLNQLESLILRKCGDHRKSIRFALLLTIDMFFVLLTLPLSLLVRLDFRPPTNYIELIFSNYLFVGVLCYFPFFFMFKTYSTMIRLASLNTALRISVASLLGASLFYFVTSNIMHLDPIPRSVFLIQMLLFVPLAILPRFSFRIMERIIKVFDKGVPTIVYGAGRTTNIFLPILLKPASGIKVVGLVDDDGNKRNADLQGVRVLGTGDDLKKLIARHSVEQVIICMPQLSGSALRALLSKLGTMAVTVKIAPNAYDYIDKREVPDRIDLRDINIEDLLRRPPRRVDRDKISNMIQSQTVLVTGGGGSIGSELCRQIVSMEPKALLINDASEFNLYSIIEELKETFPDKKIIPILGRLDRKAECDRIFHSYQVDLVLHAAAYKHVPLVEENILSAVQNNIVSTLNLFDASWRANVKRVILISSDKAVRPTNVMGATKRACELIGLWYSQNRKSTIFSAVRFGNVLGSSGSVIPKFLKQIKDGGPVTITHPDITRYFMLIPEAVSLVLQAAQSCKSGEIYVLDMGEPIKILDLARDLITIAGMKEGEDIQIQFSGLRKGEKMYEELYLGSEELERVSADYYRVASECTLKDTFIQKMCHLIESLDECTPSTAKALLFDLIRAYDRAQEGDDLPEPHLGRRSNHEIVEFEPTLILKPAGFGV
jgi:FlaA1/EpsC-like NDP-sugar epimerase